MRTHPSQEPQPPIRRRPNERSSRIAKPRRHALRFKVYGGLFLLLVATAAVMTTATSSICGCGPSEVVIDSKADAHDQGLAPDIRFKSINEMDDLLWYFTSSRGFRTITFEECAGFKALDSRRRWRNENWQPFSEAIAASSTIRFENCEIDREFFIYLLKSIDAGERFSDPPYIEIQTTQSSPWHGRLAEEALAMLKDLEGSLNLSHPIIVDFDAGIYGMSGTFTIG